MINARYLYLTANIRIISITEKFKLSSQSEIMKVAKAAVTDFQLFLKKTEIIGKKVLLKFYLLYSNLAV